VVYFIDRLSINGFYFLYLHHNKIKKHMKKMMTVLAVALIFAACNGAAESTPAQDSTAVKADTTVVADTTVKADTAEVAK
jgi:uncharacterized lipoprotein YajG